MKNVNRFLAHHLKNTHTAVENQWERITSLETELSGASDRIVNVETSQQAADAKIAAITEALNKSLEMTQMNRQRESRGNFIISGENLSQPAPNENLFHILYQGLLQKYGIYIQWEELKALHRLSGNKIFFSLFSRMPGTTYEYLISKMNSNPQPQLKIYVNIQLFEPFSHHF